MITKMTCEMEKDCVMAVTHIGEKGYIYCKKHAIERRQSGYERTRTMRVWEIKLILAGKPLPSYRPLPRVAA